MNWVRAGQQAGMTEADSQAAHRSPLNYPLMMSERLNVKCLPFVSVCVWVGCVRACQECLFNKQGIGYSDKCTFTG